MKFLLCTIVLFYSVLMNAQIPSIGVVQSMEADSLLFASGYTSLTESVSKCFSPIKITDEEFASRLTRINLLKVKLNAANIFIPQELKLVGPETNEVAVQQYAEKVFKRCQQAGIHLIIWGSGGARRVPDGFDPAIAKQQFVAIAKKLAVLATRYDIVLALENLNRTETNFCINLKEALDIVKSVDQPGLQLSPDLYHMMKENEGPDVILDAGKYIVNCEVAEKEGRTPPGIHGDDFRPYFRALRKIGYAGKISIECHWSNLPAEAGPAHEYLKHQIEEAFQ